MNDRLCIECFNELSDEEPGYLCLDCDEGDPGTWPWEMCSDFEEIPLSELDPDAVELSPDDIDFDPDTDEEE